MVGMTKLRGMHRRRVIGGILAAVGGAGAVAALVRYLRPRSMDAPRTIVVDTLPDTGEAAVIVRAEGVPVLVRRRADGSVTVMRPTCTHQGCSLKVEADHLRCPCHNGTFTLDGQPRSGPPKLPLHVLPSAVRDGKLHVTIGPDDV
jgi:Rieske Fe-S protein